MSYSKYLTFNTYAFTVINYYCRTTIFFIYRKTKSFLEVKVMQIKFYSGIFYKRNYIIYRRIFFDIKDFSDFFGCFIRIFSNNFVEFVI